ncbi:MAG: tetratricopeptide repeat protein [Verrucomicrobiales bacterium]
MKTLILAILLPLAPLVAVGAESSAFAKGNAALLDEAYADAVQWYEKHLDESGPDAATLYNLGNAHYRLGDYGPAVHAYERARLLDPRAADIRANLKLAREAAAAFDDEPGRWEAPLHWLGLGEWLFAGGAALVLLAISSLAKGLFFQDRAPAAMRWTAAGSLLLLFASVGAFAIRHSELKRAIVLNPNAPVRLSPFATAEVVATLQAGRSVEIGKEHGGFFRVANGWIAEEDAAPVYPREPGR